MSNKKTKAPEQYHAVGVKRAHGMGWVAYTLTVEEQEIIDIDAGPVETRGEAIVRAKAMFGKMFVMGQMP